MMAYVPESSPETRDNAPVSVSSPYNDPAVIEYPITGSEAPNTLDWLDVGVTVIARPATVALNDAVELEYAVGDVGMKSADSAADPKSTGTQSHTAVVEATATAPQPVIVVPSNLKFTLPARDVVAVMRFVVRYCGDPAANSRDTVVEAYPTEIVKFDVDAVAPFASLTVTDTVEEPATVGVPEIVPVEVLRLKPSINVPVSAYVREARPPALGTAREKALFAVPDKPIVGVGIVRAVATVSVAVVEVLEVATPLLMVLVTTDVYAPASLVAIGLIVKVEANSPLMTIPSFLHM